MTMVSVGKVMDYLAKLPEDHMNAMIKAAKDGFSSYHLNGSEHKIKPDVIAIFSPLKKYNMA